MSAIDLPTVCGSHIKENVSYNFLAKHTEGEGGRRKIL